MHLDRLSPLARARWASLLGVVVASALAGGSLVALSRDVLPFSAWPSLGGHGDARQRLAAAPELARRVRSGGGGQVAGDPSSVLAPAGAVGPGAAASGAVAGAGGSPVGGDRAGAVGGASSLRSSASAPSVPGASGANSIATPSPATNTGPVPVTPTSADGSQASAPLADDTPIVAAATPHVGGRSSTEAGRVADDVDAQPDAPPSPSASPADRADPAATDPLPTDPAAAEPVATAPVPTESTPTPVEPAAPAPTPAEPVTSAPADGAGLDTPSTIAVPVIIDLSVADEQPGDDVSASTVSADPSATSDAQRSRPRARSRRRLQPHAGGAVVPAPATIPPATQATSSPGVGMQGGGSSATKSHSAPAAPAPSPASVAPDAAAAPAPAAATGPDQVNGPPPTDVPVADG